MIYVTLIITVQHGAKLVTNVNTLDIRQRFKLPVPFHYQNYSTSK